MQTLDALKCNMAVIFAVTLFLLGGNDVMAAEMQNGDNPAVELKGKVNSLALELLQNISDPELRRTPLPDGVLVCTFVDLKKMYRTSSFGRYLAEQLMGEFQRRNFRIVEMRKSTSVQIQEKHGEYGLSRDPVEINHHIAAGAMLTGTYMATADHVIVNAKLMENANASLLSSATMIFEKNALMEELLGDASSALKKPRGPIYMKRLEL